MTDSMPVPSDLSSDPNYQLGAAKALLQLIQVEAHGLVEYEWDPDDPACYADIWRGLKRIEDIANHPLA